MKKKAVILITLLLLSLITVVKAKGGKDDSVRVIAADVTQVKGPTKRTFQTCVGAGRAAEGLRAVWQEQLMMAKKDIGFKYIRFHGLLSDDMHVYTEDSNGHPIYNWQYIDHLYDFLLKTGVRPFVELGFMPPALASNNQTVFWWQGNISPPKSYEKWTCLITALVTHFQERYGKAEVSKWYFEVWNEPNLKQFFSGDINEYFKLYELTARAIKNVSKEYRVGGPATSGSTWISEALNRFSQYPDLVDFISTHAYGTRSVFDEYGKKRTQMREPDGIPNAVFSLKKLVAASAFKDKEIHITEWNSSPNPKDPLHDTYQNAAFALNTLKKTESLVNSMSYWTFTDIFEEAGPPVTPFHGGFGLINLENIKKPTYYAYQCLNELGGLEIKNSDADSWVTKDNNGDIQALCWNYKLLSPDTAYNQQFYNKIIPAKKAQDVEIKLSGIRDGNYTLQLYKVGFKENDPYTAYLEMGAPARLSLQQETRLKQQSVFRPASETVVTIKNGIFYRHFQLDQNEICFFKIKHK